MVIELTKEEKELDLERLLHGIEADALYPGLSAASLSVLSVLRSVTRVALWLRAAWYAALDGKRQASEELARLREQNEKILDDLNCVRGERDKLVSEIESGPYCSDTSFDEALNDLSYFHFERLESLTEEPGKDDPFRHVALAEKHGLGLDAFPIFAVEEALRAQDMGSYENWRKIAHAALLAMSYLRHLVQEAEESLEDLESD